ncbi:MAG: FAD-binding oxidoreductase [Bacteroidota bacterium]|nr:FAD-binding oxidoreductase [Bacteroidota bacterium]MDP4232572.1 FAD-binding oxidoreductase [Bacteroidota bacterium]MDP4242974.1 FAD-binding oxidoreductase [Bacteroidota bacterium]MDP4286451.1 FAD-binding oxidoreductase [Bacteroidota bacterium]
MQATNTQHRTLPIDHLEPLKGWGGAVESAAYVFRPSTVEQLKEAIQVARDTGRTITLRGAGRSYGDAALGRENITIDFTRMNRILAWDPSSGIITCEPGVTIAQLWRYIIEDGYWPPVVPGTMFVTLGGALGMNLHGKNNFKAGPIGDHVLAFDFVAASGEEFHISREAESELFFSIIGSFGMLGCFTRITLKMKRVYSGDLDVKVFECDNLHELFKVYDWQIAESDYLVGWIDAFAVGAAFGRAIVHQANYLAAGVDPMPAQTLRAEHQDLPETIVGLVPKSIVWVFLRPFTNAFGMKFVNWAKFLSSKISPKKQFRQAHAAFAFLLDYVPNWKKSYGPIGLIQYQSFIPEENAEEVFRKQIALCQKENLVPFLAVFKRHRPDSFLMTHAVDGYSLALDFKVTRRNRSQLWKLTENLNALVLQAGGRFYMAKDATLTREAFRQYLGADTLARFRELKRRFDPDDLLQTELSRRLLMSD